MKRGEMLTGRSVSSKWRVLGGRLQVKRLVFGALVLCVLAGLGTVVRFGFVVNAAAGIGGQDKSADRVWQRTRTVAGEWAGRAGVPESAVVFRLDEAALRQALHGAEIRDAETRRHGDGEKEGGSTELWLPMPGGEFARFRVVEAPVMKPELAEQFPEIKSYRGWGMDDSRLTMRCDLSPLGFHAAVTDGVELMAIHPVAPNDRVHYVSYAGRDYASAAADALCLVNESKVIRKITPVNSRNSSIGTDFRDYDIAIATTGEYAQAYGGGTVSGTLSSLNSWLIPLNVIYERELSIGIVLTANNSSVIYTNSATDPFTNGDANAMVDQVRTVLGNSGLNYDLGLVLGTGTGSGSAYVGVVCETASDAFGPYKGGGAVLVNGLIGNTDSAHLMAHEIGHQFGATHTQNANCGNRTGDTAYETGSGLTLMSNAGSCGSDNIATVRSGHFHSGSFEQIVGFLNVLGGTCATTSSSGNAPPTVNGGADFVIPRNTPFALTASGGDANNDPVTYSWEQVDAGGSGFANPPYTDAGDPVLTTRPIFRPFDPVSVPVGPSFTRFFPSLTYILNNQNTPPATVGGLQTAENLPNVNRGLNFRVTARDGRGGVANDSVQLTVDAAAGPFAVTAPNTAVTWPGNASRTVTWNVAGTDGNLVNCANVKISLSTDGGQTFPNVLAAIAPNTGSAQVTVSNQATTTARIKVEAVGNVFFDISDTNFTIIACPTITVNPTSLANGTVGASYSQTITASGGSAPYTYSVSAGTLPNGLTLSSGGILSGAPTTAGVFNFTVKATANNSCEGTRAYSVAISAPGSALQFYPLATPVRLLDTRTSGQSGCFTPGAPITGGTSLTQLARGTCGIAATAQAVTGNVTVVTPATGGFLTIYPSDATQPLAANTNYAAGVVLNNVFTVGLGNADGTMKIFAQTTTHVVVDITGYYAPPATGGLYFHPLPSPVRLLETRVGEPSCFTTNAPLTGGTDTTQQGTATCSGVTIPAAAKALVGNATTVAPAAGGFLTLYPSDVTRPITANGNYGQNQTLNSPFTVGLSSAGQFKIYTSATTHLVIDVLGYFSPDAVDVNGTGLLFNPITPVRLLETRTGEPGCTNPGAPLAGGTETSQPAQNFCTIAATAKAIVGNATVVQAGSGGFLTFWPSDATRPLVATSNYLAGDILNRHFTVGLGANGQFKIFAASTTHLVVDVSGYFAP